MKKVLVCFLVGIIIINFASLVLAAQNDSYYYRDVHGQNSVYLETDITEDYVIINNVEDLKNITNNLAGNYKLGCDLYLNTDSWEPIGTENNPFIGKFDGQGHTIYGLNGFAETYCRGLFGYCGSESVIEHLIVEMDENVEETLYALNGYAVVGMIAGISYGRIGFCSARGNLKDSGIYTTVRGGAKKIGMICGSGYGEVYCCKSEGSIYASNRGSLTTEYSCAGGIVGSGYASVRNCVSNVVMGVHSGGGASASAYAGGISGMSTWDIAGVKDKIIYENCLAISKVTTPNGYWDTYFGGIIYEDSYYRNNYIIQNCHYMMDWKSTYGTGNTGRYISEKDSESLKKISTYKDWDFKNIWMMGEDGYPELRYFNELKKDNFGLLATIPGNDEKNVVTNTDIILYFSYPVDIDNSSIILSMDGTKVDTSIQINGKKVIIRAIDGLKAGIDYSLYIDKDDVKILAQEKNLYLENDIKICFSTLKNTDFMAGKYISWINTSGIIKKAEDFISLKWIFSRDQVDKDTDLNYIPGTNLDEYIVELKYWADKYDIKDVKNAMDISDLLNMDIEIPMKQQNMDSIIMSQISGTTLKDLMRDVIFIEKMQSLLKETDMKFSKASRMDEMTSAYREYYSYSQYVYSYLKSRNGKNNSIFITTIAPILYNIFLVKTDDNQGYRLYKQFYNASNLSSTINGQIRDCLDASDYVNYMESSNILKKIFAEGETLYQAFSPNANNYYYKSDGTLGINNMSTVKFASDCFSFIQTSNNKNKFWGKFDWVEILKNNFSEFSKGCSAVKVSIGLGSSIGMFPLVVDMYNDMYEKLNDNIKTFYFISDYYIANNFPELYELCFGNDYFPKSDLTIAGLSGGFESYIHVYGTSAQIEEYENNKDNPILQRWCKIIENRIFTEVYLRNNNLSVRRELANYATICSFIQSIDTDELKMDIVKYASAMLNRENITTVMVACPVTLNVYDKSNGKLVESITDANDLSDDNLEVATYIIGENANTKCVVLDLNRFSIEIVPYSVGEMDICIADYESTIKYSNIKINISDSFILNGYNNEYEIVKNNVLTLEPDSNKLLYSLEITPDNVVCEVGDIVDISTICYPTDAECELIYTMDSSEIGYIDEDKKFHATNAGITMVKCEDEITHISVEIKINVLTPGLENIVIDDIYVKQMTSTKFKVPKLLDTEIQSLQWYSTNPNVAFLTNDGRILSFEKGETVLQASYKQKIISAKIIVEGYMVKFDPQNGEPVYSIGDIPANSVIDEPKEPVKKGYKFLGWYRKDDVLESNKFEFTENEIDRDIELVARWEKLEQDNSTMTIYEILSCESNDWVKGTNLPLIFKICSEEKKIDIKTITIDGIEVSKENYRLLTDSKKVELMANWLDGLPIGEHKLKITFQDGIAETYFNILEKKEGVSDNISENKRDENDEDVEAGENEILMYFIILDICVFVISESYIKCKKL